MFLDTCLTTSVVSTRVRSVIGTDRFDIGDGALDEQRQQREYHQRADQAVADGDLAQQVSRQIVGQCVHLGLFIVLPRFVADRGVEPARGLLRRHLAGQHFLDQRVQHVDGIRRQHRVIRAARHRRR